jgi:hypothetical protein
MSTVKARNVQWQEWSHHRLSSIAAPHAMTVLAVVDAEQVSRLLTEGDRLAKLLDDPFPVSVGTVKKSIAQETLR